jgi:predicted alpha/beta hydrolase family esterase
LPRSFLILHGYGFQPETHWQTWLAERLNEAGERVAYPELPDPFEPSLRVWREALASELRDGQTVLAHSLAAVLWLHHCHDPVSAACPDRVLLVAPPSLAGVPEAIRPFFPAPLAASPVADTRLVCSDDDPYCPEGAASVYGEPLGLAVDLLEGARHINPESGYGPWPAVEAWCYGESAIASSRIAPG